MRTPPDPPLPTPPAALDRADWLIATALFVGLSVVYFLTLAGITSSNDGSHYALLRTMVENRAFTLNQFDDFAEGNDVAITPDGRLFSDRPPGTAVAGIPFYWLGGLLTQDPLPEREVTPAPLLIRFILRRQGQFLQELREQRDARRARTAS